MIQIKTTGLLGNINTDVDTAVLTQIGEKYHLHNKRGRLQIEEKITASIYKSGVIQIHGVKKIEDITRIWKLLLSLLQPYIDISKADISPTVKFIVASDRLSHPLNLHQVMKKFADNDDIEYEPEQFPAAIWHSTNGTVLLFSSGSMIITGPDSIEKIEEIVNEIREIVDGVYSTFPV